MAQLAPVYLLASDDQLFKNERSQALLTQGRQLYPQAELMLFTYSDLQGAGEAHLARLENELMDPGLFGGGRLIKIYFKDLDKTAAQTLHLIAGRLRPGVFIIAEFPRINASFGKLKPKKYQPKLPTTAKAMLESAVAEILGIGGVLELKYLPDEKEMPSWLAARCRRYNVRASRAALEFLSASCEGNLVAADQALQIISMSLGDKELDVATLGAYFTRDNRYTGFELAEALLNGQPQRALNILNSVCSERSLAETLPLLLGRLDAALSVIPKAREHGVERLTQYERNLFFMQNGVTSFKLRDGILMALRYMTPAQYDFMCSELARATRLYSTFDQEGVYRCLQNLCLSLQHLPQLQSLQPLRERAL